MTFQIKFQNAYMAQKNLLNEDIETNRYGVYIFFYQITPEASKMSCLWREHFQLCFWEILEGEMICVKHYVNIELELEV